MNNTLIKRLLDKFNFNKSWDVRNLQNAEVMLSTLEVPHEKLGQYIFLESSPELIAKLYRLNFEELELDDFPSILNEYTKTFYNNQYNIAFNLYEPQFEHPIKYAMEIAVLSHSKISIMLASMRVLLPQYDNSKKQQVTKQLLMG
jgi:hypothetical protein